MLRCIGGLSKMIDNQAMVDRVPSVDEGLRALFRVNAPMARLAVWTSFIEAVRYAARCPWIFCRSPIVVGLQVCWR
jgi:hypothetical protein